MDSNKELPFCERPVMKNVPLCCILRETGFLRQTGGPSRGLQLAAEERLILKNHEEYDCHLPDGTRSTFLMVFSPDGKMVASTHGNHNVYVTDFTNGRNVKTLTGHPRTPWCIAFHPSSNQILASGCLGGQVRVWDLHGGSEIWMAESQTVIASLAFHPTDRVLVIASYNELHFWDWSQAKPFAKCCTSNEREKVRYVAFDEGGGKLVTGIANAGGRQSSQWDRVSAPQPPPQLSQLEHERRITICYRYMVEQYEQLLDRYYRLHGGNGSNGGEGSSTGNGEGAGVGAGEEGGAGAGVGESNGSPRTGGPLAGRGGSTNPPFSNRGTQPPPRLPYIGTAWRRHALALTGGISTIDRGTDPMEPAEESPNRCAVCRRTNISSDENEPGPSSSSSSNPSHRHVTGTDEVSASHSSSQFMPERTSETDQSLLSLRTNLLFERLARLRAQVETGRNILARTRTAAAAMTARMSPSAPEEASLLIERTPPTPREESPASRLGHLLMLPEPLIPQDRPSIIRRIGSYLSRRRNPARAYGSTSSSESASLSDGLPAWERPLTPPPPRAPASLTSLRLTNLTGPASNRRVLFDHVSSDGPPHTPNPFAPQNTSYHSPRRYFRDSGSNTEPPSESNSSDSNSSSVQRNTESSLAIGRLRAQFRRLQSVYNIRGDREPHLLREAADDAERRLVSRLTNLLERPFPSTSSIPESRFPSPQGASSDLSSVRFGLDLLGRHIDNLSNQCSRVRLDTGEMTRMWEELESQVATLERAIRQEPPVVRVSPENSADGEGTGVSSSPLPTDEESEDSVVSNSARRLLGPRRFRFLHRPAYKRPRFDRHLPSPLRFTRRNLLGSPDDESDENDDDDEEGERRGDADGGRGSDDSEGHGLKRKATPDTSTPLAGTSSTPSNETPRGFSRISVRVRANSRRGCRNCNTPRNYMLRVSHTGCRPLSLSEYRENSRGRENQDDRNSPRGGRGTPSSRENIRNRARHDLLLMVDSLTQFFENDTLARTPNNNENLRERTSNLINLLEFALNLTDLLLTQLGMSNSEEPAGGRERRGGGGWHQPTPREENPRPSHRRSSYANPNPRRIVLVSEEPHPSPGRPSLPLLRVNDGPVPPETSPPSPRLPEPPPPYPASLGVRRTRALPSRLLRMPFLFDDSSEDSSHDRHDIFYRAQASGVFTHDTPLAPHHRIQAWDFSKYKLPEIHLADKNVVVAESKVHNDASVDISKDSKLLVTLLPSGRLCITTTIGVYSLQWETLGQCLYVTSFDMNAVSVSLSPTNRHLLVGLAARRVHFIHTDKQTFAQILRLEGGRPSRNGGSMKGRLVLVKELETSREMSTDYMSLNCIRWSPTPGEAIVYGTNTGKLKVLR